MSFCACSRGPLNFSVLIHVVGAAYRVSELVRSWTCRILSIFNVSDCSAFGAMSLKYGMSSSVSKDLTMSSSALFCLVLGDSKSWGAGLGVGVGASETGLGWYDGVSIPPMCVFSSSTSESIPCWAVAGKGDACWGSRLTAGRRAVVVGGTCGTGAAQVLSRRIGAAGSEWVG